MKIFLIIQDSFKQTSLWTQWSYYGKEVGVDDTHANKDHEFLLRNDDVMAVVTDYGFDFDSWVVEVISF